MFFPRELWVCRKRKETNGWKIKNATGCYLVQIHPSCFVSEVVCPIPKIAIQECFFFTFILHRMNTVIFRCACVIIWCPECWKWHFRASSFQNFLGGMPPHPPRLMGVTVSCSYIPLTNRVRGPYCNLRTEFFSSAIYGPSAKRTGHKSKGKKRGSVSYSTDQENEVSKIFITSVLCV